MPARDALIPAESRRVLEEHRKMRAFECDDYAHLVAVHRARAAHAHIRAYLEARHKEAGGFDAWLREVAARQVARGAQHAQEVSACDIARAHFHFVIHTHAKVPEVKAALVQHER